jgi:hypothetical protein
MTDHRRPLQTRNATRCATLKQKRAPTPPGTGALLFIKSILLTALLHIIYERDNEADTKQHSYYRQAD